MANSFRRVGNGAHPVLVLHGWFGDSHSFEPMEAYLDTDRFSYVFMDYRGYGGMQAVAGAFTMDEIAADAIALADTLGFASFSLIGHSMGGMAAERIAMQVPERVRKIVAVAPVPACGMRYDDASLALLADATHNKAARQCIIDRSTGSRLPKRWLEWKADYSWRCSAPAAFAAYGQAWIRTNFSEHIVNHPPLKLLVGEHDPTFNAALMQATVLTWHPEAALAVIANAGHYPMNEAPLALVGCVEAFLA